MRILALRPSRTARAGLVFLTLLSACATLGPRIQGETDLVAWQATDLRLEQRDVGGGRKLWYYSFGLLIRETRGTAITFNEIEWTIYQPGTASGTARYRGSWKLDARDQFRIPLQSTLSCGFSFDFCTGTTVPIPLYQVIMRGTDERGRAVSTVIDLALPADPPSPPQTTSKSVRAIELVPPKR